MWVEIQGFPDYYISNEGMIVNTATGKAISTKDGVVFLYRDRKQYGRSVDKLVRQHFKKERNTAPRPIRIPDKPRWKGVEGFPNYRISNFGEVHRIEPFHEVTPQGPFKADVKLWKEGKQYTRGVRKLTRDNWGELSKL